MTEHQEIVPVSEPGDASSAPKDRWQRLIEDLQRERDEIRVRLHLARKEIGDDLDRLDERIEALKARSRSASTEAGKALDEIDDAAKQLWTEIREGFDRVRRSFTD